MITNSRQLGSTLLVILLTLSVAGQSSTKPKLQVKADGFPGGHETPEGVASDLARARIQRDVNLYTQTCIGLYESHKGPAAYQAFLESEIHAMEQARAPKASNAPEKIAKVFAARHLRQKGPASYGYATFVFRDVMFVDVLVSLKNAKQKLFRTLVIQEPDGTWYAHPNPDVSPLLDTGLETESPSLDDFSTAYEIAH